MAKGITAHMVVKNDDRFVWYAISSVIPYVDKFIIYDTGSSDNTVPIIQSFNNKKIIFAQKGEVNVKKMVDLRNEQIKKSETDWIWLVDGDEIYPDKVAKSISKIISKQQNYLGVIVHRYDLLGDIYHCQNEKVGVYNQFGKIGHYVLRLINKNKIEGLQVKGEYPNEYYANKNGQSIKMLGRDKFAFVEERIFHAMYLQRSTETNPQNILNRKKLKIESGIPIPKNELAEVFLKRRPAIVPDVTGKISTGYKLLADIVTPIKKLKRKFI